jgi:hypothetical protein
MQFVPEVPLDRLRNVSHLDLLQIGQRPLGQDNGEEYGPDEAKEVYSVSSKELLKMHQATPQHGLHWAGKADADAAPVRNEKAVEDGLERPDGDRVEQGDEEKTGNGNNNPPPIWPGVSEKADELVERSVTSAGSDRHDCL